MSEGKRKIAIAVDDSDHAMQAFEWYMSNIRGDNDYLVVIHAPEVFDLHLTSPTIAGEVLKKLEKEVKALEKKYEEKMVLAKQNGKFRTGSGKPGEVVCRLAEEEGVSMLITGTRGQGKLRRTIMGSVSDYLVHHAKMPIIVCRNK